MHRTLFLVVFLVVILAAASTGAVTRSVWDGVYTKEQSRRGQAVYHQDCAKCHGQNLAGGEASPPLAGADFLAKWNGKTAGTLYETMRKTMPPDDPGALSLRQYADIIAYVFSANDFPSGDKELDRDPATLDEIRIEAKR